MFNPFRSVLNFFKREFIVSDKKRQKNLKSLKSIIAFGVLSLLIISEAQTVSAEYKQQKKKINDLIQPIQQDAFASIYEVVERAKRKIEHDEILGY